MATEIEKKQTSTKNHSRINEIVAVILLALAVLVFLCLVTYSATDWSLNTSSSLKTQNWIGVVGAVVADLLFQTIGLSAYIFPALLALIAWRVFYTEHLIPRVSRIIGFLLFIVSASSLVSLLDWRGGLVGAFFSQFFVYLLSPIGAAILLFTFLTASILLLTNFSFFGLFDKLEMPLENLRIRINERLAKWRVSRKQKQTEAQERAENRLTTPAGKSTKIFPTITIGETPAAKANGKAKSGEASIPVTSETSGARLEGEKENTLRIS
jgi:S-DNA-T family DNA segregation ATPase FtsK/SpoIIIE